MKSRLPKLTPEKISLMHFLNSNPNTEYHVKFCFKSISRKHVYQSTACLINKNFDLNFLIQIQRNKYMCCVGAYFIPNAKNLNKVVGFSKRFAKKFNAHFFGWENCHI